MVHNNARNSTTRYSLNQLLIGLEPDLIPEQSISGNNHLAEEQSRLLHKRQVMVAHALNKMANSLGTPETQWKVGQKVWLEAKNLPLPHGTIKLAPKRHGPFQIVRVISPVAYQLQLPHQWNIHPVFHASLLTPYVETDSHRPNYSRPPPDLISGEAEYEVEQIRSHRRHGRRKQLQYLLKWKGYPESDNTWEPADQVHAPDLIKAYHRRHQLEHIKATTPAQLSSTHSSPTWSRSSILFSAPPPTRPTGSQSSDPALDPTSPTLTPSSTAISAESAIARVTTNTKPWPHLGALTPLPANASPFPETILTCSPCPTTPRISPMNPHLGLPRLPPSSSINPNQQLRLLAAQAAKLSLRPSPLSQPSVSWPTTSPSNVPETSPEVSLPPSSIGIPSIALKPTLSLATMRSSKRKSRRLKPRSPTTTTTPRAPTGSSPTQAKSRPPSLSARAMHAPRSGFVSETMDRWSYSPGRTIMRYRVLQNSMQTRPTTSTDQSRLCPPGSSSSSTVPHRPSTPSALPLPSSTTGGTSPRSSDTDTSMTPSASSMQSSIKYVPNSSWLKSASRAAAIVSRPPVSPTRSGTLRAGPMPASSSGASLSPATARASTRSASASTRESRTRGGGGVTALGPEEYSAVLLPL